MTLPLTIPPKSERASFLDAPVVTDLDALDAHVAFLGIPYGNPYSLADVANAQSRAPAAIRQATGRAVRALERHDFDLGGPFFDGKDIRMADCGDVPADPRNLSGHFAAAEQAVRTILKRGALPIILGGDHSISIPALRGCDGAGPITLIQIDAHVDWRDEFNGYREGLSSPIRRASEMAHIDRIVQVGIRAQGSARAEELAAAKAYGAQIITADELADAGMDEVLARIPDGGRYYLTLDARGLDPSVMPAVAGPVPDGVSYRNARKLIHGLVRKGRVVGMDIVEITPQTDATMLTAITAGRLIVNLVGAAVRAGYFD